MKLDPVERVTLVVTLGSVGAVCAFAPPRFALGVAVGAAIEAVNLRVQVRAARRFFEDDGRSAANWMSGFGVRFGLMACAILLAIELGTDLLGLAAGLVLALPGVFIWAWRNRSPLVDEPVLPALAPDDPSWDRWSVWRAGEVMPDDVAEEDQEA
ncbi:MAG: ATP synthase subunit I [Myxococcota bacterium]|nr:ATP synthase subunit I [Myxococcota bacterium]